DLRDGLGNLVVSGAFSVVIDQSREDRVEDLAAANLVGVGRDERVLRLGTVGSDDGIACGGRGVAGRRGAGFWVARATREGEGRDTRDCHAFKNALLDIHVSS